MSDTESGAPVRPASAVQRLAALAANPTAEAWDAYRATLDEDGPTLAESPDRVASLLADLRTMGTRPAKYAAAIRQRVKVRPAPPTEPEWYDAVVGDAPAPVERTMTAKGLLSTLGYDSPVPVAMPSGYMLADDGRLMYQSDPDDRDKMIEISPEPVVVVASITLADGDAVSLELTWRYRGAWRRQVVDRRTVADTRAIVALASSGFPVSSVTAGEVVRFLAAFEAVNREWLPSSLASKALGWVPGRGSFLWGTHPIGEPVRLHADEGSTSHARAYHDRGTLGAWLGLWTDAAPYPRVALAVYAALAPVVLGVVRDADGFVVDWAGRTSGGKSTALRLAASVWGSPNLIQTWNTTAVGMERYAALHHCLPVITDDTQHAKGDPARVGNLIYLVTGNKGRLRASVDGLRASSELRTVLLSTGEAPATSFTEEAGAHARTLSLIGMPMGPDHPDARRASERIQIGASEHYGQVGPLVVRHLLDARDRWPALVERWRALREEHARDSGPAGRAANYLATLTVAAELAEDAAGLAVHRVALDEARACADSSSDGADRALAAVTDMLAWLASRGTDIYRKGSQAGPARETIATYGPRTGLTLVPTALRAWLKSQGYDAAGIVTEWKRREWVVVAPDRAGGRTSPVFDGLRFTDRCDPVATALLHLTHPDDSDGD